MKKKIRVIILTLSFVLLCFIPLSACDNNRGKKDSEYENVLSKPEIESVYLNATSIDLEVLESFELAVFGADGANVNYSVENDTIATVDKAGSVKAKAAGSTKIKVVAGEKELYCEVNVENHHYVPFIVSEREETDFTICSGDTYTVKCYIVYNGKKYLPEAFAFSSSDSSVCAISADGEITALKAGDVTINVSAVWQGVNCESYSISVSVIGE